MIHSGKTVDLYVAPEEFDAINRKIGELQFSMDGTSGAEFDRWVSDTFGERQPLIKLCVDSRIKIDIRVIAQDPNNAPPRATVDDGLCHNYDSEFDGQGCRKSRGHEDNCGAGE
jgi:hypothetical protein